VFAFSSGFAALIYQVAWSRMLSMTFGSSTLAVSAVVAGFMGGMGIGAWLYHRVGDRVPSPLRAYGLLEIAIAVSTALLTLCYLQLPRVFADVAGMVPAGLAMNVFRIATTFLLLLVPAAVMGGTYPALCRALIYSAKHVDRRLGWIYGLNTIGAAAGALATGFVLIEQIGSTGAVLVANAINLVIGIASLLVARRLAPTASAPRAGNEALPSELPHWTTALVLFGSGFATLGYEIVWFRALHYLLGPGTYTLSTLLSIFLLGLGFGGLFYRVAVRWGRPERNLGFSQLCIAALAICAIGAEHYVMTRPALFDRFSIYSTALVNESWQWRVLVSVAVATALMLPATLWMGLTFPLASRLFLGDIDRLTARVGLAYLLSNLGSILGAIVAALFILPRLGTVEGTRLLAGVNLALGLLVLLRVREKSVRFAAVTVTWGVIALSLALPARLAFGPKVVLDYPGMLLAYEEESELGTVQVFRAPSDRVLIQSMAIDGAIIAAMPTWDLALYAKQIILAHLPMTLDRDIRKVLAVGVASGSTVAEIARYPWVAHVDALEINSAVVRAGLRFPDFQVFEDPRVDLVVEDALHFLLATDQRYDLIVNDAKEHLRFSGNSKVLSAEFYRYALDRLTECGLFVQEIPLIHDEVGLGLMLRTFERVFPVMEVFLLPPGQAVTVGSRCPIGGRVRPRLEELETAGVAETIRTFFSKDPTDLGALWIISGPEVRRVVGEGPINTWNDSPLEFHSYRQTLLNKFERGVPLGMVFGPRLEDPLGRSEFSRSPGYAAQHRVNEAVLRVLQGDRARGEAILRSVLAEDPDHVLARVMLVDLGIAARGDETQRRIGVGSAR